MVEGVAAVGAPEYLQWLGDMSNMLVHEQWRKEVGPCFFLFFFVGTVSIMDWGKSREVYRDCPRFYPLSTARATPSMEVCCDCWRFHPLFPARATAGIWILT